MAKDDDTTETSDVPAGADDTGESKPSRLRRAVEVPGWMAAVVAALVLLGAGFAIGWFSAPGGDHHERGDERASVERSNGGDRQPNRRDLVPPRRQRPDANGVVLGVAVEDANGGGARLAQVLPGGPAADAGLQPGDVITAVDDTKVANATDLARVIRSHKIGDSITIHFRRGSNDQTADVKLVAPTGAPQGGNGPPGLDSSA